jgi:hypothetical protein
MSIEGDPVDAMARLLCGFRLTQLIYVAAELKLADVLEAGPKDVEALAIEVGAHPEALYRVLRALASHGVFVETGSKVFASTPMADALRINASPSLRPMALSYGQTWWWGAFGKLIDTVRTGQVAFDLTHGESLFSFLAHEPAAAEIFNASMSAMTQAVAIAIADAWRFDEVKIFMDVGGGDGTLAAAILTRWPHLRGIVFDQSTAIEAALRRGQQGNRCTLVQGDFFSGVPSAADVYILKDILHDWNDDQAVAILKSCRLAMASTARLLIVERLMPQGNELAPVKHIDITMLVMTGGRERTLPEYTSLLSEAGLSLILCKTLTNGGTLLEVARSGT